VKLHPEVTISLLPGGYLIHTARLEGEDIVQDPHIYSDLKEAVTHATRYFDQQSKQDSKRLEDHII
jgi:hypothetical protein